MPDVSDSHFISGSGTGSFTCEITGLEASTDYYVRAYAINSKGTSYGSEIGFTTLQAESLPTVAMGPISNITSTTADIGGVVLSIGSANVSERGICWSTSHNPTTSGNHSSNGMGLGDYVASITNLIPGTIYYVRAYAKNNVGLAYSIESSFTTLQNESLPTVTTSEVINITQSSAMGGGNVISTGNSAVIERGVCWSTSHNPTISGSHASNGMGNGNYNVSISGLATGTTYYVRAYAVNSVGTAYGDEVSFTTLQNGTGLTVTTGQVTNISTTTAVIGGTITSTGGGSVYERGVCWSNSHNPTLYDNYSSNGAGLGNYTVSITGLTPNTYYYVKAYVISSLGLLYGNEVSFKTAALPSPPIGAIHGAFSVSENEYVYFSQGNLQYKASSKTWRFAEHQWDYVGTQTPDTYGYAGGTVSGSDNANISSSYNGWIDLFGWGTSGYNHGAVCYQPWSTSRHRYDYYAYGSSTYNLYDQTGKADWGYNKISNGNNEENYGWHTLSKDEWRYVFNTRTTSSNIRYAMAKVNNVNGIILLPDDWDASYYSLCNTNTSESFESNIISANQWLNSLESHGAVFLPAAGYRGANLVNSAGEDGAYWSSSYGNSDHAYKIHFGDGFLYSNDSDPYRCDGRSVRLVFSVGN